MSTTPRPWKVIGPSNHLAIVGDMGEQGDTFPLFVPGEHQSSDGANANAAFIVRAVNAHDALTAQNTAMREALEAIVARYHGEWDNPSLLKLGPLFVDAKKDILQLALAALARGGEKVTS